MWAEAGSCTKFWEVMELAEGKGVVPGEGTKSFKDLCFHPVGTILVAHEKEEDLCDLRGTHVVEPRPV